MLLVLLQPSCSEACPIWIWYKVPRKLLAPDGIVSQAVRWICYDFSVKKIDIWPLVLWWLSLYYIQGHCHISVGLVWCCTQQCLLYEWNCEILWLISCRPKYVRWSLTFYIIWNMVMSYSMNTYDNIIAQNTIEKSSWFYNNVVSRHLTKDSVPTQYINVNFPRLYGCYLPKPKSFVTHRAECFIVSFKQI